MKLCVFIIEKCFYNKIFKIGLNSYQTSFLKMLRNLLCPLCNVSKNTILLSRCAFSTEESLKIDPPGKSVKLPFSVLFEDIIKYLD